METDAFLDILERIEEDKITLVSSDILSAEVGEIANLSKRRLVELYLSHCARHITVDLQIVQIANQLVRQCQLKPKDALHIASACHGHVRYLLTCDDRVTKKRELVSNTTSQLGFEVKVLNPVKFLSLVETGGREGKGA